MQAFHLDKAVVHEGDKHQQLLTETFMEVVGKVSL